MEEELNNESKRVYTEKKDFPLSTIKDMFDEGDIIPQPDYQRDYVYDEMKASKLIESALMGIPIPTIYLCEENDGPYSIIDGQQRMTSFVKFLKNEFKLKKLEELSNFNGLYFKDLDKTTQRNLKSVSLNTIILSKQSENLKYEIFARLNQGSVALTAQELRNCIYRGSFNDLLEDIALTNKLLPELFIFENKRKKYQEYVLRFFALKNFNDYSSSIGKTMNVYMSAHKNDNEKAIDNAKKLFIGTIDIIKQVLGNDAFCAYDRQNKCSMNKFSGSVYDSIIVAFSMFDSHNLMKNADEIRKAISNIKANNQIYSDYTYAATGSKDRVIGRIMIIYNAIKDILEKHGDTTPEVRCFSNDDKQKLWNEHYICSYCGQEILAYDDAEVDHIFAYSKGGDTVLENAQLLHRHCNREKNDKLGNDDVDFEDDSQDE